MSGINYQRSVYMLVVLTAIFKNRIDKYLVKEGYSGVSRVGLRGGFQK